jgi:membrane protease YdiL (CAAX protease family)
MPRPVPAPPAQLDRRTLREEVLAVLSLSLLASAVYAVLSLVEGPLRGAVVAAADQDPRLARQLVGIVFGLAPVYLVWHLLRRSGEGPATIGVGTERAAAQVRDGAILAAAIGLAGAGVYAASVSLGLNRIVVPVPPLGHWWTVPMLVLHAVRASAVEEVIVLGYLVTRLEQLGWSSRGAIAASALLRATYHLYQGWGGFVGNLAMGLLFGSLFVRRRRLGPFLVAHVLLDVGAGLVYVLARDRLPALFG